MDSTSKQPVSTLSYNNWRKWFQLVELYFIGQEMDFVLHQTEAEYCTVQSGPGVGSKRERLNIEKQQLYRRASARVLYTISVCIDPLDADLIHEFDTVKEKWYHVEET